MYTRKLPLIHTNLKFGSETCTLRSLSLSTPFCMLNKLNIFDAFRTVKNVRNRIQSFLKEKGLISIFHDKFYIFPQRLRQCHSSYLINLWAQQCECVVAQKLRKGHQMFNLTNFYAKLREENKVKGLISCIKKSNKKRAKEIMFGAVTLGAFEWNKHRISEKEMKLHINDLSYVYTLREKTLCQNCHKKKPSENTGNICDCDGFTPPQTPIKYDNWETFVEKNDLVVWRRLHESGSYEYKVYGSYNDVSAEEFLNVQIDTDYRRKWDTTAIVLEVVEHDPEAGSNSEILYWEMLWPMMFANRDYVFVRRFLIDYSNKAILVANKSTMHATYPDKKDKFRVKDYWSYMVIYPYTELNKTGIEFVLTYYDNPGVSIPSKITSWVAMRAMPDFLERLRDAAKKYKDYCKQHGIKCICLLKEIELTSEEQHEDYLSYFLDSEEDLITDNTIFEAQHNLKRNHYKSKKEEPPKPELPSNKTVASSGEFKKELNDSLPPSNPMVQRGTKTFWKYFNPSYYIS